ncbi:2-dehydro-3-deoxygalactonokinase [Burkholderiaceae bacterium FT117]|uniref:2-dehydro-3-deoxygalactonokinase n=1 Tax=Zeimonas sediminis TaxID=2944268 RepID=UPI0023430CE3|nr:2-dehydro-3-deoxygalactonokinase [Zeimonas sediminis]MCM5569833.1 2-dehydro-3-deoxygalactonokinase [Zeimonas sediminis]
MDPEQPLAALPAALAARAKLIALDWGTTSLRGWLLDDRGQALDRREAPLGILNVRDGRFAEAFEALCAPWLAARPDLPAIASGMIGSRQGWREAPYVATPAGFDALAAGLLALDDAAGRRFRIVPGLVDRPPGGSPDVIRGEETQVFGVLGAAATQSEAGDRRLFLLPGTHSKWVETRGASVAGFRTCMTGELYAVLRQHSILGRLCEEPESPDAPGPLSAFDDGVERGLADPGALGHLLFTVRSEGLLGQRPPDHLPGYLSGLLIGAEIGDALKAFASAGPPCVIASPALAARYLRALHRAGVPATAAEGEPARAGLFAIAAHAGLAG